MRNLPAPSRTIVMTGATRGLGRTAALKILQTAPDVHLVLLARSGGQATASELSAEAGTPHVSSVAADLSSMSSTRAAAAAIRREVDSGMYPPLSGLVGNAGLQLLRATDASVDGMEVTFAVNVLANYVLVDELQPYLSDPSRIVITTSDTHFGDFTHNMGMVPGPQWRDPAALASPGTTDSAVGAGAAGSPDSAKAGRCAYSTSKLAVIYLVHALARRLPPSISVYSFNPGFVPGTGLARDGSAVAQFAFRRVMPVMTVTPWARSVGVSGAALAAAAVGVLPVPTGSYINGTRIEESSVESYDPRREDALWDTLGRLATHTATTRSRSADQS